MEISSNNQQPNVVTSEMVDIQDDNAEINLYPVVRHIFLTICILLAISIILFLIYQNGKSIYDKGI